jgi:hypothetical protein
MSSVSTISRPQVKGGNIDFDLCIATPDAMRVVGQLGQILGPRGLMPNPKVGTVTMDVETAVKNAKAGQVQYRTDKGGIIHATIGRASFTVDALQQNANALVEALLKAKPASFQGHLSAQDGGFEHDGRRRSRRSDQRLGCVDVFAGGSRRSMTLGCRSAGSGRLSKTVGGIVLPLRVCAAVGHDLNPGCREIALRPGPTQMASPEAGFRFFMVLAPWCSTPEDGRRGCS